MEGYQRIANAIVRQAAIDYQQCLCVVANSRRELLQEKAMISECERFFMGDRFNIYTELDGVAIMMALRNEVVDNNYDFRRIVKLHRGTLNN